MGLLYGLLIMQRWILVLGLTPRSMAPRGHLETSGVAAWRRVVPSFVCALAHYVPLVVETLSGA